MKWKASNIATEEGCPSPILPLERNRSPAAPPQGGVREAALNPLSGSNTCVRLSMRA
jgi:hypothetical protein